MGSNVNAGLEEGSRADSLEGLLESLAGGASDAGALAFLGLKFSSADNLYRTLAGSVTRGELRIHLFDGPGEGEVAVLFVHIVSARTRIVAKPHAKIFNLVCA